MMRRLFYLLPDNTQAARLAADLEHDAAIKQQDIHAVVRDEIPIDGINDVHGMDETDKDAVIEWWGWRINLAVFFSNLLLFLVMLVWSPGWSLMFPTILMLAAFAVGLVFVLRMPTVHVSEFFSALGHGEILMMVDVKPSRVYAVGRYIHQRHPEAITGGVCWHV